MPKARQVIEVGARKRYETNGLHIVPSLAGAHHHIVRGRYRLRFELPKRPHPRDWQIEDAPIACYQYRQHKSGRRSPITFSVNRVTCILETPRKAKIPTSALGVVDVSLFGSREREKLYHWAGEYSAVMDGVFSYWLSVLRWRSGVYGIGVPYLKSDPVYDGTYLIDFRNGQRFFSEMTSIGFKMEGALTARQWGDVQRVLSRNEPTPLWHILLAEADQQLGVQDHRRFLVDLALACEIVLRHLVQVVLKQRVAIELVNTIAITRVIDNLKNLEFRPKRWNSLKACIPDLKQIFEYRNKIMHRGWREYVSQDGCRKLQRSAIRFVCEVEREIVRRSGHVASPHQSA